MTIGFSLQYCSIAAYFEGASKGGMVHLFVNDCATSGKVTACACV